MTFKGLEGSFNWAFEVAETVTTKLTNASPGIIFATIGLCIVIYATKQKPVNFSTSVGGDDDFPNERTIVISDVNPSKPFKNRGRNVKIER